MLKYIKKVKSQNWLPDNLIINKYKYLRNILVYANGLINYWITKTKP